MKNTAVSYVTCVRTLQQSELNAYSILKLILMLVKRKNFSAKFKYSSLIGIGFIIPAIAFGHLKQLNLFDLKINVNHKKPSEEIWCIKFKTMKQR